MCGNNMLIDHGTPLVFSQKLGSWSALHGAAVKWASSYWLPRVLALRSLRESPTYRSYMAGRSSVYLYLRAQLGTPRYNEYAAVTKGAG